MEKTYFVQRQTMSGIADEVRTLSGDGVMMKPETMREELVEANEAVVEQDGIMNEIRDILSSKRIPDETLEGLDEYVDFYDYDGTLLHRYTVLEVMGMDELPPLPQHEGLICQGWNWTLEQLKEEHGGVDVAPFYRTDNGNTRIYVDLPYDGIEMSTYIPSGQTGVRINWGDGGEFVSQSGGRLIHTYNTAGKYVIEIFNQFDEAYYLNEPSQCIFGSGGINNGKQFITKIECGDNLRFNNGVFRDMTSLETVTQHSNIGYSITYTVYNTPRLKQFMIGSYPGERGLYESSCRCIFSYNTRNMMKYVFYNFRGVGRLPKTFKAQTREGFYGATGIKVYRPYEANGSTNGAFQNSYLSIIQIPENVTYIDSNAFSSSMVEEVIIGDNVTSFGQNVFYACYNLKKVKLSKNLTDVGLSCFYECKLLESIELPDTIQRIDNNAFYMSSLSNVNIPNNLKTIGSYAFANTKIRGDLILPDSVTEICEYAFNNCYFLTSIKLSENLTTLPARVFANCYGVRTIKIPKNVISFGNDALIGNIQTVYFTDHENIPTIANTGAMPSKAKIFVPAALYDEWIKATNWSAIASRIVPV